MEGIQSGDDFVWISKCTNVASNIDRECQEEKECHHSQGMSNVVIGLTSRKVDIPASQGGQKDNDCNPRPYRILIPAKVRNPDIARVLLKYDLRTCSLPSRRLLSLCAIPLHGLINLVLTFPPVDPLHRRGLERMFPIDHEQVVR